MLFAKIQRENITANFSCNHSEISKALGRLWQDLSKDEKEPFMRGAKTLVELHRLEYPDYKYRPRKKGQPKETAVKSSTKKSSGSRQERKPAVAASGYLSPASPPGLAGDQTYLGGGGSPLSAGTAAPDSPLSSCYGGLSPLSPAGSSHCQASPASVLHTPYSPVPSIGSSSGYESEMSSSLAAHELAAGAAEEASFFDFSPAGHCHPFSPEPEADMDLELRELDVQPLDEESSLLNPLAMFPVLDLSCDDLDDLAFSL